MISVVIITKNEATNIGRCLKNLTWANEIIVIDDYSIDETRTIAQKFGARIYLNKLSNNFSKQRNFGLNKAKGEWVLFVDADEVVLPSLANEIKSVCQRPKASGYYLHRQDFFGRQALKHGETSRVKLLRLARKNAGKWQRQVHETWRVQGKIGLLKNSLNHYPHPNLSEFIQRVNFYSSLHAQALAKQKKQANLLSIVVKPTAKFCLNYFIYFGLLDKMPGLLTALMMSLHSFLAQAKLYQNTKLK